MNLLETAIDAALRAGDAIMEIYNSDDFGVEIKGDNSPLTKADKEAHLIIKGILDETKIQVLSEEGKEIPFAERKNWDQLWIVDPIDGTKEFIKRNGEFTVNIALIENQVPVMGVIYVPALNELYYGDNQNGAFKVLDISFHKQDGLKDKAIKLPISNSSNVYTVVASKSHLTSETEDFINELKKEHKEIETISKGSSLKLCMVAEGTAHCYPRFAPTMEWDTAAGQAICMAAGFDVLDWSTKKTMLYNREQLLNNWFLVS